MWLRGVPVHIGTPSGSAAPTPASLDCLVLTPPGTPDPALAIAASRAGAVGVVDLSLAGDTDVATEALSGLLRSGRGRRGVDVLGLRAGPPRVLAEDAVFDAVLRVADRLE